MCGFAGIINSPVDFHSEEIVAIADRVRHRGPDAQGIRILDGNMKPATRGNNAIFFNRLSIIDLDPRSDQPFEDDRYLLVFNGEIYNYQEIRRELQKKQYVFHTESDTEVLFLALQCWKEGALSRLNGMFAFFWLDKLSGSFMAARDKLGIKPLYYGISGHSFAFGSELHSLIRLFRNKTEVNKEAVRMMLWMQFVPTPHTILHGMFKLNPGAYIAGSFEGLQQGLVPQVKIYWDAYQEVNHPSSRSAGNLEQILKDSLTRQLHADVPLGLFLSSGVDSSLLAAMVHTYFASEKSFDFFTIAFKDATESDESADADAFIRGFNNPRLKNHVLPIDAGFVEERIDRLYNYYDEPFGDPAALLNWAISEKCRQFATVAISGDGADELFWGYPRYKRWQEFSRWNRIRPLSALVHSMAEWLPASRLQGELLFVSEPDPVKRHYDLFLPSGQRFAIHDHITHQSMWATEGMELIRNRPDLPAILDIKTYLADAMLYKVDRSSMASSLEVRVPYLDDEVLFHALKVSLGEKSNQQFPNKAPLKELLLRLAPHYPIHRPKKGFGFPLEKWLRETWKERVLGLLNKSSLEELGLDAGLYYKLVKDFYSKGTPYFTDVWYVFNLLLWYEKYKTISREAQS